MTTFGQATIALALAGSLTTAGAQAQSTSSAPWRAWHGCWSAAPADAPTLVNRAPVVCVSPTSSADAVRITTIVRDSVTSAQTVDASGRVVPLDLTGCTGTTVGRWSADRRRVYLSATATCDGLVRTTSSILAMTADGDWLDVQGVGAAGAERVRVARYRESAFRGVVPSEIVQALRDGGLPVQSARVAAGADIGVAAVVEAAKAAGVAVTEAFVLERGQRFALDARQLVTLADAGVSPRVTDAMIVASNPAVFSVNRPALAVRDSMDDAIAGRRVYVALDRFASPWGWGYDPYGSRYGRSYDAFGYNGYNGYGDSRYGLSGGYGGYGAYGYPGYTYGGPVIIVRGSAPAEPHGRLVKGRGYEQGDRTASPNTDRAAPMPSRAEARGGDREPTSNGSGSSGNTERTAKPRPQP